MLPILDYADCPQDPIRGWTLAVLGYGNQGRAQALNLRDSGHAVLVGAVPGRASADFASAEGFAVVAPNHLAEHADLVAVLTPDETHRPCVTALARAGGRIRALVFAHGFALRFDPPPLSPAWDVVLVAPSGPGVQLRSHYLEGSGIPALFAVHQNASGEAEAVGRAYAAAVGCARAGLLVTTVAAETEVDLFGEQAVLCGGMNALCRSAFETLVEAGYPEEMAYLECVQQLKLTAELVERFGVEGMRRRISPTALYGDLSRGPGLMDGEIKRRLTLLLEAIRSGAFAREWLEKAAGDAGWPDDDLARARHPAMERAGETIRRLYAHPAGQEGNPQEGSGKGVDNQAGLG